MIQHFYSSFIIAIIGFAIAAWIGGLAALFTVIILTALEISLSFDNAIVNAVVLKRMSPVWQRRFLTWGMIFAVFIVRFLLPIFIVAVASGTHFMDIARMALYDSDQYGALLDLAHPSIAAFGGMFLVMVFLKYFFDDAKDIHWMQRIESWLIKVGSLKSIEIVIALLALVVITFFLPEALHARVLVSGILGVATYVLMHSVSEILEVQESSVLGAYAGLGLFLYLQVLDISFSLDGVIGAFAISNNILIIMLGLSIGAYFVRSMTLYFVKKDTLGQFRYLEHGAHYAVGILGIIMLVGIVRHIPEFVTALLGALVIIFSFLDSIFYTRRLAKKNIKSA